MFSASPEQPVEPARRLSSAHTHPPANLVKILCLLAMAAVATLDIRHTAHLNLSIVYIIVVVVCARVGNRRLLWEVTFLAVILTYAGYFLARRSPAVEFEQLLLPPRIINRTLAAAAILGIAGICHFGENFIESVGRHSSGHGVGDRDRQLFAEIALTFQAILAGSLCCITGLMIVLVDLVTPANYNLPILYCLPVLIVGPTRSRKFLWLIVFLLLAMTFLGFYYGRQANPGFNEPPVLRHHVLIMNRIMAAGMLLISGLIMHFWMGPSIVPRGGDQHQ